MDLSFTAAEEAFRADARAWLTDRLDGPFAQVRGRGGPGDEHVLVEERWNWERALGEAGWTCVSWPTEYGGRGGTFMEQVIFYEEHARARGPGRVGLIGEGLIGPTILHFGTDEQKRRFLPAIARGEELWCQGYSEPEAGSDLANLRTRARRHDRDWVIDGQKVWTSLAHIAQWCFVLARTDPEAPRHRGISYLLVAMDQPGVEVRPILQLTGTAEFNEVFFDRARTPADHIVGEPHDGWRVAMGTLAFERGALTLGQQLDFRNELEEVTSHARRTGRIADPTIRSRLALAWAELMIMRWSALRTLSQLESTEPSRETMVSKLYWASWHRRLGELAMDVLGPEADLAEQETPPDADQRGVAGYNLTRLQRLFLFTRADTIYGGSNEIQRNIIGERALGLPLSHDDAVMTDLSQPPPYPAGRRLLAGKTVLVTAAAGTGIGFATARRCAEEGARVVLSDHHERRLSEAAEALVEQAGGEPPATVVCDVTVEDQVQTMVAAAVAHGGGRLDILVNNAGLGGTSSLVDMADSDWHRVLDVTLTGTMRCTRAALRHMYDVGSGVIVNNASVLGWRAQPDQAHYAAAKAGVMALTRVAAAEGAAHNVRVNAVSPSFARHPFLAKVMPEDTLINMEAAELFGRGAEPWEVANVIVFLASDLSSYMSGEVVSVSSQHP